MLFLDLFCVVGLTKMDIGCILYDTGSNWTWCSPQKLESRERIAADDAGQAWIEDFSKNLSMNQDIWHLQESFPS